MFPCQYQLAKQNRVVTHLLNHATMKNIPKKSVGRNRTTLIGVAGSNVPHRVTIGIGLIQAQQLQPVDLLVKSFSKIHLIKVGMMMSIRIVHYILSPEIPYINSLSSESIPIGFSRLHQNNSVTIVSCLN